MIYGRNKFLLKSLNRIPIKEHECPRILEDTASATVHILTASYIQIGTNI